MDVVWCDAEGVCQNSAREVVDAARPQDGGRHLRPVRLIRDINLALKLVSGYPVTDLEMATGSGKVCEGAGQPLGRGT